MTEDLKEVQSSLKSLHTSEAFGRLLGIMARAARQGVTLTDKDAEQFEAMIAIANRAWPETIGQHAGSIAPPVPMLCAPGCGSPLEGDPSAVISNTALRRERPYHT